jgi:hypothetical protein
MSKYQFMSCNIGNVSDSNSSIYMNGVKIQNSSGNPIKNFKVITDEGDHFTFTADSPLKVHITSAMVQSVDVKQGSVKVNGTVTGNVQVNQGRIEVDGSIRGDAKVSQGSIIADTIGGTAKTNQGSVNANNNYQSNSNNYSTNSGNFGSSSRGQINSNHVVYGSNSIACNNGHVNYY